VYENEMKTNDKICKNGNIHLIRLAKKHAIVRNKHGEVTLEPVNGLILHNGKEIKEPVKLKHQDRYELAYVLPLFVFLLLSLSLSVSLSISLS